MSMDHTIKLTVAPTASAAAV